MPNITKPNKNALIKALGGDLDLVLFFVTWLKNGLNGRKAYQELHPGTDEHTARTLASRLLAKVDRSQVMAAYSLGPERYFQQLYEGLNADKWNDFTGEREPDHKTRRTYHEALGKILGYEGQSTVSLPGDEGIMMWRNKSDK